MERIIAHNNKFYVCIAYVEVVKVQNGFMCCKQMQQPIKAHIFKYLGNKLNDTQYVTTVRELFQGCQTWIDINSLEEVHDDDKTYFLLG